MLMRTVPVLLLVLTLTGCGLKTTLDTSTEQTKTASTEQTKAAGSKQTKTASSKQTKLAASADPVKCLNFAGLRSVVTIKDGAEWQGFHSQNGEEAYAVYIDKHATEDAATQYIMRSPELVTGQAGAWTVTGPRSVGSGMNHAQLSIARNLVGQLVACIRR